MAASDKGKGKSVKYEEEPYGPVIKRAKRTIFEEGSSSQETGKWGWIPSTLKRWMGYESVPSHDELPPLGVSLRQFVAMYMAREKDEHERCNDFCEITNEQIEAMKKEVKELREENASFRRQLSVAWDDIDRLIHHAQSSRHREDVMRMEMHQMQVRIGNVENNQQQQPEPAPEEDEEAEEDSDSDASSVATDS